MANEDKMFELIEKMYIEMKSEFNRVNNNILKIENKIENDIEPKFTSLFDGYKQMSENITEIKSDIKEMSGKLQNQEVEIKVLKAVR